jgi:hypothetical protein
MGNHRGGESRDAEKSIRPGLNSKAVDSPKMEKSAEADFPTCLED